MAWLSCAPRTGAISSHLSGHTVFLPVAILLFIGIICIQKKLSEILTASPTFSLASITTWSYIVKIEKSACLFFLLSSTSFTIEKRYNFSSLFRSSSTMWGSRIPQSRMEWPLFVGREFLRIRPMIEQITSAPLQKCVSTWRGGSEKREEQSGKSPLDLGSAQDALEGANSSCCSFLSCSCLITLLLACQPLQIHGQG